MQLLNIYLVISNLSNSSFLSSNLFVVVVVACKSLTYIEVSGECHCNWQLKILFRATLVLGLKIINFYDSTHNRKWIHPTKYFVVDSKITILIHVYILFWNIEASNIMTHHTEICSNLTGKADAIFVDFKWHPVENMNFKTYSKKLNSLETNCMTWTCIIPHNSHVLWW